MTEIVDIALADGEADWTVLELDGVQGVAGKAARKLSQEYEHTIEYEDALQEALIILAQGAPVFRNVIADPSLGLGVLHTRLYQALVKVVRTEAKYRSKHLSHEMLIEGGE